MSSRQHTSLLTRTVRITRLALWLLSAAWIIHGFQHHSKEQRHTALTTIATRLLNILHIRLQINRPAALPAHTPILTVANHVSWLDVFVLMSQHPSGFIAKQSIQHWPVIGRLATHIGTVFINRQSNQDVGTVNHAIASALRKGQSVTFFPEARTSEGQHTLPFKAALFQAAIDTATPVQAIALRYYDAQGQRTTAVSYVGKTPLLRTLWRIARLPEIQVNVDYAPLIESDTTAQTSRYHLKDLTEQFIGNTVNQPD